MIEAVTGGVVPVGKIAILGEQSHLGATFLVVSEVVGLIGSPKCNQYSLIRKIILILEGVGIRIVGVMPPAQSNPDTFDVEYFHQTIKGSIAFRVIWG